MPYFVRKDHVMVMTLYIAFYCKAFTNTKMVTFKMRIIKVSNICKLILKSF